MERHRPGPGGLVRSLRGPDEEVPGGEGVLRRPGGQSVPSAGEIEGLVSHENRGEEARAGKVRGMFQSLLSFSLLKVTL